MAKKNLKFFDYSKVARLDADMWRAYYRHNYTFLFILLLKLMRLQFQFSWLLAIRSAFYSGLAAADYRINKGKENNVRIKHNLTKFYKLISDHSIQSFNFKKASELELEWWNIHRYPDKYKKKLVMSLAEAISIIYNSKPNNFMEYARFRAEAMLIRDEAQDKKRLNQIG